MEKQKTALPVIAGVLILVSEGFKLLGLLGLFVAGLFIFIWPPVIISPIAIVFIVLVVYIALTALAVIGGIEALRRKHWGLALTGAVIAALPFSLFGVAAVILVVLSREEFE